MDDSVTKPVNYNSNVCWNTTSDNNTCQYWDGTKDIETENVLTGDIGTENDDDDGSDEDFCCFKLIEQGRAKVSDVDDGNEDVCDFEDDGLIWITSEETTSKITDNLSNPT